jgi:hypothetical protein
VEDRRKSLPVPFSSPGFLFVRIGGISETKGREGRGATPRVFAVVV